MLEMCTAMKHKTTTAESGESLELSGRGGGDIVNLPSSLPGEAELEVAVHGPWTETNNIKQLLDEFKELYYDRLRCLELDNSSITREELLQKKVTLLQSYVSDLADQNQVLVQTVEDLHHAHHEVSSREVNVCEDDWRPSLLDESVGRVAHLQNRVLSTSEDMLLSDLHRERRENGRLKQKAAAQLVESSDRLVELQSRLSCLRHIHSDSTEEMAAKDLCITKLQANVALLRQEQADARTQLSKMSVTARELQEELSTKQDEWGRREDRQRSECENEQQTREEEEKKRDREWEKVLEEERKAHAHAVQKWAVKAAVFKSELKVSRKQVERQNKELSEVHQKEETLLSEMKEREKHLERELGSVRKALDSKEERSMQLARDNARLAESLASLQSKLQTSECAWREAGEALGRARSGVRAEEEQRRLTQEQLQRAQEEAERLRQDLAHAQHATQKKIQKREIKMCALVKELTESQKHQSECQKELLGREAAWERLREERDELRAKTEELGRERVALGQSNEKLGADLALSHDKLHTSRLEVRSRNQLILQMRAEMNMSEQKHQSAQEQVTALEGEVKHLNCEVNRHQEESRTLSQKVADTERFKDQEKEEGEQLRDQLCVSRRQLETFEGKVNEQEAEIRGLHQQLKGAKAELGDSGFRAQGQNETLAIFRQKYAAAMEKVHKVQGRTEHLAEELRYSQQQLKESQLATRSVEEELGEMARRHREKVGQWESSQEALDQLTDELQANQSLLRDSRQKEEGLKGLVGTLQEQTDSLKQQKLTLECDLGVYQQSHSHSDEEYLGLLQNTQQLQKRCSEQVECRAQFEKAILQMKSELERQVQENAGLKESLVACRRAHATGRERLEQEVTRLAKEVTRSELEQADARKVHAGLLRRCEEELKEARGEAEGHGAEVNRLQQEAQEGARERRAALRDKESADGQARQLCSRLKELRAKHQATVEELAAVSEEARRMEGCLSEGKLAEEKIRSTAVGLESDVKELRRDLRQAVDHKGEAERETRDAQDQADALRSELDGTRSDNAKLRRESQLVMSNVNRWITTQKTSNESLTAQMKAQNKVLQHLQEANDTLNAEAKTLKEAAHASERDAQRLKAQIRELETRQGERTMEKEGCVALNLCKIEEMQTRLRSNLEAIGMLNQQLNTVSGENKRLRGQLEEERSVRRRALLPSRPPSRTSRRSLSLDMLTGAGGVQGILGQAEPSRAGLQRPGEAEEEEEESWSGRMTK